MTYEEKELYAAYDLVLYLQTNPDGMDALKGLNLNQFKKVKRLVGLWQADIKKHIKELEDE